MSEDLVTRLRKRAEIRRSITTRKSVQNNEPDRIADLLEESADLLEYYILRDKSNQRTIKDLSSKIVFASDIKLYGYGHSDEYENGFWDAVDFVKKYQNRGEE